MTDGEGLADQSVGVTVPDEHVGAFVAQAFEDPERVTDWDDIVDDVVAADARDAWDALSSVEQVCELLAMADDYDERAVAHLEDVPLDRGEPTAQIDAAFEEAMRCRRNADRLRDAIASAYGDGRVDDDELVEAVETHGFETGVITQRERLVESVTETYGFDFRPYGGTLMDTSESEPDVPDDACNPW